MSANGIAQALDAFIADNGGQTFQDAVNNSTTAGFGGSGYSVELFEDGTFRVLWDNEIGNLYASPGLILAVPQFDQDTVNDMQEYGDDADLSFALEEAEREIHEAYEMSQVVY
jgi:hypothetical protein